jgi:hypothetical protein
MNDSMSNFAYTDTKSLNFVAPGKRPRSTISPTIVFREGKPEFAIRPARRCAYSGPLCCRLCSIG